VDTKTWYATVRPGQARGGTIVNHNNKLIPLETILRTEELDRRQSRPPDFEKENRALVALTQALSDSPHTILQTLADTILNICDCGSAGISLLTTYDGGKRFYWPAIAGQWKPHIGGGTPRDFGPCGTVLDRNCPLLFTHVERVYTYFEPVVPAVEEALLVPFYVENKAVGTIWAVAHDHSHKFDAEDKRQLLSLGRFASAAYQAVISVDASRRLAAIVESSDDAIIGKSLDGIISSWNRGAERLFGYTAEEAIGQHITLIIPPDRLDEESMILGKLRQGQRVDHFETIRMRKDRTLINISLTISPIKDSSGRVVGASKVARDITERMRSDDVRKKAELTAHLTRVQDTERRRIARELHDGVGNLLAGISMNAAQIAKEKEKLSETRARCLEENLSLIQQACVEIRTVSYLLHPPLLDEMGLQSAIKWYIDGFAERSKIKVTMEIAADLGRLSEDYELSLFRIAQECLTNIHRHSGSLTAFVRLSRTPRSIEMEVRDEGRGIEKEMQSKFAAGSSPGVGLRGMQERARLLGGELTVQPTENGTSVLVILPLTQEVDIPLEQNALSRKKTRLAGV
jgi:PAS domain S-box-containing protein